MPKLIRARDNRNAPIVEPGRGDATLTYFNLLRLGSGGTVTLDVPRCELLCVVLSGRADIAACAQEFKNIGRRADIWDGPADSVYCGTCPRVTVRALRGGTEVAVAGAVCAQPFAPFRIPPEEVEIVEVGTRELHARRRVFHILGANGRGRAGCLHVSEVYADEGCWSGYPPHKHDTERPPAETDFEEVHHYRFRPESGFGAQFCYGENGDAPVAAMTRHGDTFLVDRGYHPTVTSPGHEGYVFTILAGRKQRSLARYFDPRHIHLAEKMPGLPAMRETFS
jgi:5-deoxy-glucuronate isomerase